VNPEVVQVPRVARDDKGCCSERQGLLLGTTRSALPPGLFK
jgi:hypothetical protein